MRSSTAHLSRRSPRQLAAPRPPQGRAHALSHRVRDAALTKSGEALSIPTPEPSCGGPHQRLAASSARPLPPGRKTAKIVSELPHAALLLALSLASPGLASARAPSSTAEPTTSAAIGHSAAAQEPSQLIFICLSEADPAAVERTLTALQAELADLPATVKAVCSATQGPLTERVEHATAITHAEASLAAIWLDLEGDHLVLYTLDPEAGTVQTRRIAVSGDSEVADLDALAVIARSTLDSLLRDRAGRRDTQKLPAETPPPQVPAQPAVAPPRPQPKARGQLRLMIGYTGSRYAPILSWQSGLDLAATYLWAGGAYAGASYQITSPISLDPYPLGGDDFIFGKIRRRPFTLVAGYEGLWPVSDSAKLGLEAEFGVALDVMAARTPVICVDSEGEFCDTTHTLDTYDPLLFNLGFAPRVRLLVEPHPALLLYLGAGLDAFADQKIYAYCSVDSPPCAGDGLLFAPYNLRPLAQAGLIFRI